MHPLRTTLIGVTVVGLGIDAFVHFRVARGYDAVGTTITEGALFRFEGVLAIAAAVLLIVRPNRITAAIAALVAGGGALVLLVYYFVNVGPIGPLPNMSEHLMYAEKTITLVAQGVATASAITLVLLGRPVVPAEADAAASSIDASGAAPSAVHGSTA